MSEWQKVSNLVTFGSTWNIHGIGKTYVESVSTFTQEVNLWIDAGINGGAIRGNAGFWFPGNGVDSYLVGSATISYGGETRSLKVNGRTAFYVPKEGRWSDWVSIYDWVWEHSNEYISVTFTFSIAYTSAKIPTAPAAPSTPVGVSAYEYTIPTSDLPETELEEEVGDLVDSLPYTCYFESIGDWETGTDGTGASVEINKGLRFYIAEQSPDCYAYATAAIAPFISNLPDKFTIKMVVQSNDMPEMQTVLLVSLVDKNTDMTAYLFFGTLPEEAETPAGLYTPLTGELQTFKWEIDKTGSTYESFYSHIAYYYNDQYKGNFDIPGSASAPISPVYLRLICANNHETAAAVDFTVKSIEIIEGNTDRSLAEVTSTCTLTVTTNPDPGDTLILKGGQQGNITFTFVDHYPNNQYEIQIGADTSETASNIATAINNYTLAEFSAEASTNTVTVTSLISGTMTIETTGTGISVGTITSIHPGFLDEEVSAADSFTVMEGGKSVQENASASDAVDGLIDGLSETVSATAVIDCLMDSMDENANASAASDNFDGLIDYMGDET